MSDRLTLTRAFEGAGLKSGDAERIATEIYDAIHDSAATKADLRELEQRLDLRFAALDGRFAEVKTDLFALELRLTLRLGAIVAALFGLFFAALHYWPPSRPPPPQRPVVPHAQLKRMRASRGGRTDLEPIDLTAITSPMTVFASPGAAAQQSAADQGAPAATGRRSTPRTPPASPCCQCRIRAGSLSEHDARLVYHEASSRSAALHGLYGKDGSTPPSCWPSSRAHHRGRKTSMMSSPQAVRRRIDRLSALVLARPRKTTLMALMLGKTFDALIAAGAPADKAREAAEEPAGDDNRLAAVEARLTLLTWTTGFAITLGLGTCSWRCKSWSACHDKPWKPPTSST